MLAELFLNEFLFIKVKRWGVTSGCIYMKTHGQP